MKSNTQMKFIFSICLLLLSFSIHAQTQKIFYNVRDYGAKGDSITIDSDAINNAIEAAAANGGGTVYFPPGIYASYSIRLKSKICLFLDQGAILLGAAHTSTRGY